VTVYPETTTWGLTVTMARDTYAAGKLTVEAYEQILREAVERSNDAKAVSLAMANLGQLVESRGDVEQAEDLFRRVVAEADPDEPFHAASMLALANLVWQRGDGAEAGVWWRRAMLSGDPEAAPKAAFNLGAALVMQGRLVEAVEALRLAIDSGHPDEAPGALVRLGIVRAQQGDLNAARAAYEHVAASGHPEFARQALALLAELDGQHPSTPTPRPPPVTEPTREAPPTSSKRGAGPKRGGRLMPLWGRKRGSGKEATPSPTGQLLAEGWNGLRWDASLSEFKARFPQATEAAERSWGTDLAREPFCGIAMTTRYFFNRQGRLCGMAFIPDMPDRERMPPFVINELGWPPDGNNLLWVFDDVEVKVATVVTTVSHRRLTD
jgi:Tfp pilus assembly protein PilF